MTEIDQHDEPAEGGGVDPAGEGSRQPSGMQEDAAEGDREDVLQAEQQGKGYGGDEGERDQALEDD